MHWNRTQIFTDSLLTTLIRTTIIYTTRNRNLASIIAVDGRIFDRCRHHATVSVPYATARSPDTLQGPTSRSTESTDTRECPGRSKLPAKEANVCIVNVLWCHFLIILMSCWRSTYFKLVERRQRRWKALVDQCVRFVHHRLVLCFFRVAYVSTYLVCPAWPSFVRSRLIGDERPVVWLGSSHLRLGLV